MFQEKACFAPVLHYNLYYPVKAGICGKATDDPLSSALTNNPLSRASSLSICRISRLTGISLGRVCKF